ncbi:coniferyl aldehyde dehydrogenase [Pararhodobacter sp.]|uniref:coniferyl aldehyde dehydrogenase n=1 Tax=Pararhodobacter sp. TaxID=2127056 RepID=UPI002FDCAEA0
MHPDQTDALFARHRAAFEAERFATAEVRRARLARIEALLRANQAAFCEAISADFGNRPHQETELLEIAPLLDALRHTRARLARWMKPERRSSALEFLQIRNRVEYQPLGVVGIMAPWNYPLYLCFAPLIDVLAAGNRAMLKPSEQTPRTSALIARTVGEFFAEDEVSVVNGGPDVAAHFAQLPFDHLVFTGSTGVARKVMAAAAANLTPLTLELGGKSPAIIAPGYPIDKAAQAIAFGKLMNAGQTCIAPDYVLAPRAQMRQVAEAILARAQAFYPAPQDAGAFTSVLGAQAHARLVGALEECRQRGAEILTHDAVLPGAGMRMAPSIVLDPPPDCLLMREEIFGPVLPVVPYDRLGDALALVNAGPRPLALYAFSNERAVINEILAQTHSGNVTVNGTLLHVAQHDLPFGGVGPSGMGAYHGRDGFRRFSHARGVAQVRLFDPSRLIAPPYGRLSGWLKRVMMR